MPQKRKTVHDLLMSLDDTRAALHLVAKFGWIDREFFLSEVSNQSEASRYAHWKLLLDLEILIAKENHWTTKRLFVATKRFHRHFPEIPRVPTERVALFPKYLSELRLGYALMRMGIQYGTRKEIWPRVKWHKDRGKYPSLSFDAFLAGAWRKYRIFVFQNTGTDQFHILRGEANVILAVDQRHRSEALDAISCPVRVGNNHFSSYVLVIDDGNSEPLTWKLTGTNGISETLGTFLKRVASKKMVTAA